MTRGRTPVLSALLTSKAPASTLTLLLSPPLSLPRDLFFPSVDVAARWLPSLLQCTPKLTCIDLAVGGKVGVAGDNNP